MPTHHIPYQETGYFSKIICDYLDQKDQVKSFYHRFPDLEGFKEQILEKSAFKAENRVILVDYLTKQYDNFEVSEATAENIKLLGESNTFTITTGHQLNLFTGPLYFLYKIISAIKLSRKLKQEYPESNFVPIYWMATEDHDFEEINYFMLNGKKVKWNRPDITNNDKGAVGNLSTEGLDAVYKQFCAEIGSTKIAKELCDLFETAYLKHDNL
ncbi:MAG: bacillithiol biosynthesis BshC, partial [Leeuwenhoekiella sp.]